MSLKKENEGMHYTELQKSESERYAFCQETITMFTQLQIVHMALAQRLYDIRENKLYLPYWENFNAYCTEMSAMSSSQRSKLLNIHERVVIEGGISSEDVGRAGWSKVYTALPLIHDPETARHWVDMATQLSKKDLEEEVAEARTGKLIKDCQHTDTYTIRICKDCGFKERVYLDGDAPEK